MSAFLVTVPSQAAGHKTLVPQLMSELQKEGLIMNHDGEDVLVVVGGVVPPEDYQALFQAGVGAVFGPGTRIPSAAMEILSKIKRTN